VQRLNSEVAAIAADPEFQARLESQGTEPPRPLGAPEFRRFVQAETQRWGEAIRRSGAKVG
jgi:tripartite-type tricarboxylate transporter receptor subunit TctC